jgi:hypothetical protein
MLLPLGACTPGPAGPPPPQPPPPTCASVAFWKASKIFFSATTCCVFFSMARHTTPYAWQGPQGGEPRFARARCGLQGPAGPLPRRQRCACRLVRVLPLPLQPLTPFPSRWQIVYLGRSAGSGRGAPSHLCHDPGFLAPPECARCPRTGGAVPAVLRPYTGSPSPPPSLAQDVVVNLLVRHGAAASGAAACSPPTARARAAP